MILDDREEDNDFKDKKDKDQGYLSLRNQTKYKFNTQEVDLNKLKMS